MFLFKEIILKMFPLKGNTSLNMENAKKLAIGYGLAWRMGSSIPNVRCAVTWDYGIRPN